MQETVASLKQQLADAIELGNISPAANHSQHFPGTKDSHGELHLDKGNMNSTNEGILLQAQRSGYD
ncbi:kinesin-related protein 4-like [Trifolium medium]|uniref:Kinesin-related protein 4-like n=1 Tax=Trifolium medium TaxID=97028 RepID=A0A392R8C2_9FABA|nr:kinesin-related protein 4-like [Trifolium medium]